ncbi:MAG TPA: hypothetical protein PK979_00830 [Bacteroidales bacterium]|nr:hypothetical protein [Bacteroidales bacterium]
MKLFANTGNSKREWEKLLRLSVSISPETRVAYTDSDTLGSGGRLSWQEGDKLLLAGYDGATFMGSEIFEWVAGDRFTGTTVSGATTYKAYYPGEKVMLDANGNVQLAGTFWQQTQSGDNSTAHLRNSLLLFDETANAITETFKLISKSSIIRFNLEGVPADVGLLSNLIWSVETTAGVTKSMALNVTGVTFSAAKDNLTAFLSFDPAVIGIAANGRVKITLYGGKSYQWTTTVADEKNYTVGKRYKAAVNSGWTEMPVNYGINPLSYVAEYNVNPAGDGFVTDLTACNVSGYFVWQDAVDRFHTRNDIAGYHLPSSEEWFSIVPKYVDPGYITFLDTISYNSITENVIVKNESITMFSDFRNTGSPGNSSPSYALRYKGTDWVSAWKYEFVSDGNNSHMKITSRAVAPSVTISQVADPTFWSSGQGNDVVRYFPASGYESSPGSASYVGSNGIFWASTEYNNDIAWNMGFGANKARTYTTLKSNGFSVRLFQN